MRLHENPQLFKEAINFASRPADQGGLGISPLFIEKIIGSAVLFA